MTTPPPLQGPTAKEKKYDRQLRLWAASGQAALEDAHLLLVTPGEAGTGVVGVETLKNLVLPGMGHFTILDNATVKEEDLGLNFFLDEQSIGRSRAEETCKYLQELNPDVEGHFIAQPLSTFLSDGSNALKPYSIVLVVSPIKITSLRIIVEHCASANTPLFFIHSVGFYAHFSIHLPPAFPIADTHPDPTSTADLRLVKPWPSLIEHVQQKTEELDNMDEHAHGHVPYLLLILYYLGIWKDQHDGKPPSNYREKNEFKKLVEAGMRRNNPDGSEENYEQAIAAVLKNLNEPEPTSAVKEIFNAPECTSLTASSANFWLIVNAISQFYKSNGVLPLPGSVPDMKAQSSDYIELQNVYKSKARQDAQSVLQIVRELEAQLERTASIEEREVEAFCKGAGHIKLIRGRPFHGLTDKTDWGKPAKSAAMSLTDESSLLLLYVAFLAYHRFYDQNSVAPGAVLDNVEKDAEQLSRFAISKVEDLVEQAGSKTDPKQIEEELGKICNELARAGGGELHNISAIAGGLVAQEVIKVVTKQYVPVDNTCLFDGIRSLSSVLRL